MLDDGSITHREVSIEGLDRVKFLKFLSFDFMRMDWTSYIDIGMIPENLYWYDTDQQKWDESQIKKEEIKKVIEAVPKPIPSPFAKKEEKSTSPFKLMSS